MDLADSVRAVQALLLPQSPEGEGSSSLSPTSDTVLEARVATISAEIAAALAQAQVRAFEEEEDDDYDSGSDLGHHAEGIGPKTSGIRSSGDREPGREVVEKKDREGLLPTVDEEDEFPIPLRTRKGKEPVGVVGLKRKR